MTETAPHPSPAPRRRAAAGPPLSMPDETLGETFLHAVEHSPHIAAILFKTDKEYEPLTYLELRDRVCRAALGLEALGVGHGDRVAILSENRPEWVITDLAAVSTGAVLVPIYPTLPANQAEYIVRDCGAAVLVVSDRKQLEKALELRAAVPTLRAVVVMDPPEPLPAEVLPFSELLARGDRGAEGEARFRERMHGVRPDDLASIVYTSGTTGEPKGAMLTHRNLTSNVRSSLGRFEIRGDDVILSYIPLSHIFSRLVNYCALSVGATTAFAQSIFTVASNLVEVRPTLMPSIPRLFESVQSRILGAAAKQPERRRRLFEWALRAGAEYFEYGNSGRTPPPWTALFYAVADALVLRKLRDQLGGRLRFLISGGAPLAPETGRFFASMGLRVVEGYGLTETSPVIAANPTDRIRFGTVGPPVAGVEVRIAEDGEILCRGSNVMRGYFGKPEETAKAIDAEGWFHTGDIGLLDGDGYLKITDRKKDLLVLSNGKNVAPQAIERALKASPYISDAALFGDRQPVVVALVVPDFSQVRTWAAGQGLTLDSNAAIAGSPEVRRLIKAEIDRCQAEFADFERVRRFALLEREFSMDREELTPTLKLKRRVVAANFAATIQELYGGGGGGGEKE